jgi:hypothetical protein
MKEQFDNKLRLSNANKEKLALINTIIEEYQAQGYKLTLRQLYYQLVSRAVILNNSKEYAKLSTLLKAGRMAGIVDWDAIEDRVRVLKLPYWVFGIADALEDTINGYRLDRMKGQENYIELWLEKDALSGIIYRITSKYHVRLMVNRGYSSCTAMHAAYQRFNLHQDKYGMNPIILYLGDHDPSGLDMDRDIRERLAEFGVDVTVKRIALTSEQVRKYKPPPNFAKFSDPRAYKYIAEFGKTSWEVDALKPDVLHQIVDDEIMELIDIDLFLEQKKKEEEHKKILRDFAEKFKEEE